MDLIKLPILGQPNDSPWPTPEEYTYWESRKNRTFYVDYEIDEMYELMELSKVIVQMNIAEKDIENPDPIYLFIHSYGGDLEQANFFADLCTSSRIPIVTIAMGVSMSAGFIIFLAGHKRYMFKHTQLLIHEGSASFTGSAQEIEQAQKNYKKQLNEMKDYILERTSIDEKVFNKNKNKDWYLTSQEAVDYNVASIITSFSDILK